MASTGIPLAATTVVGSFDDANPDGTVSDFTATIDWGDGSPISTGAIAGAMGGPFSVEGGHTYAAFGTYTITTVVTDAGGSVVTLTTTAGVADLPLAGVPTTFSAVEGQNTGTIVLATITDPNPLATASDLTANIVNWGDSTPSTPKPLTVVLVGGTATTSVFQVLGNHTYLEEGLGLPVTLTVTTSGGATTTFTPSTGTANVADAALSASGSISITGVEGSSTTPTPVIATFTDANPFATVADFTTGGDSQLG